MSAYWEDETHGRTEGRLSEGRVGAKGESEEEGPRAVGGACDSVERAEEGRGASAGVDGEMGKIGGSEEEEKNRKREPQKDGEKDMVGTTDERRDVGSGGEAETDNIGEEGKGGEREREVEEGQEREAGRQEDGKREGKEEGKDQGSRGSGEADGRTVGQTGEEKVKGKPREVGMESEGSWVKAKEGGEAKDKVKGKEVERQSKPKKKAGPNVGPVASAPVVLSHPRSSARSIRGAAKRDIIAKFQQNCPESPVIPNFKVQRSSAGFSNGASIKQKVLQWCQNKTRNYEGVYIENFSSSWCDGLAFCALVHRFFPNVFDFSTLRAEERKKNFTLAFSTAESEADCCPLLDVEDMLLMGNAPDPLCVFTYVQALCQHLSKIEKQRKDREEEGKGHSKGEVQSVLETKEESKQRERRAEGGNAEGEREREKEGKEEEKSRAEEVGEKGGKEEEREA